MCKIIRFLSGVFCGFFIISSNANECMSYKIQPKITIDFPEYTTEIIQPSEPMDLLHGSVVATLAGNYDIIVEIISVKNGYCVSLKSVEALIGYTDFLIKIDSRHKPNTCSYNAVLNHENKHIDEHLSVINDYKKELHNSLYSAADSIMPVFVKKESDINDVMIELNNKLQSHPDIVLTLQKIHADVEIRNKNIDEQEDYSELKKCL